MKLINKYAWSALFAALFTLTGCSEEENREGTDPARTTATLTLTIEGMDITDNESTTTCVAATYNEEGDELETDTQLRRAYTFLLDHPVAEDITLHIEPIRSSNIPEERLYISKTELTIEAGETQGTVRVGPTDNDNLDFACAEPTAQTYELGLRLIDLQGQYAKANGELAAKVILAKPAWTQTVLCSLVAPDGTGTIALTRSNATPHPEATLSLRLNKKARTDVVVTLTYDDAIASLPAGLLPQLPTLTIKAGETAADYTWQPSDDFWTWANRNEQQINVTASIAEGTKEAEMDNATTVVLTCRDETTDNVTAWISPTATQLLRDENHLSPSATYTVQLSKALSSDTHFELYYEGLSATLTPWPLNLLH